MRISDIVAKRILEMLDEDGGIVEIQRNELAGSIGCVPSQINYVLSSRFTQEQGYIVESRRGGGGYIRISRITFELDNIIMHVVNSIGDSLDFKTASIMIENLVSRGYIEASAGKIMEAAISERVYSYIPKEYRNKTRAAMFKNMLLSQC